MYIGWFLFMLVPYSRDEFFTFYLGLTWIMCSILLLVFSTINLCTNFSIFPMALLAHLVTESASVLQVTSYDCKLVAE